MSNPVVRTIDVGAGVAVSPDLVGFTFHQWPEGGSALYPPSFGFGVVRSLGYTGGLSKYIFPWRHRHTGYGVFDLAPFDTFFNTHHAAGRKTTYTFDWTPEFLRTSDNNTYGGIGSASVPQGEAQGFPEVQAYTIALINRYNDGTPQGRKLWFIETWNEPGFTGGYPWEGTAGQLVAFMDALGTAIAASNDPGVKLLTPAFIDGQFPRGGRLEQFLAAEHSQKPGVLGRDVILAHNAGVALHLYGHGYGPLWQLRSEVSLANAKAILAAYGVPWQSIHITEEGVSDGPPVGKDTWTGMTDTQKGLWTARHIILQGLLGVESVYIYSYDGGGEFSVLLHGDFRKPEMAVPLSRVHTEIAGKTITSAQFRFDGSLELIADGQLVRI